MIPSTPMPPGGGIPSQAPPPSAATPFPPREGTTTTRKPAAPAVADEVKAEGTQEKQPEVWAEYKCRTIDYGAPHPGHLVEASVLASVSLPPPTYPLENSLAHQIEQKTLSRMQLEGICYASQRFQHRLGDDKTRAGFYLGDSAGVGKGRQISGIILDNLLRGRKKHCWFSVSSDLHIDATRDLRDIGCVGVNVIPSIAALEELSGEKKRNSGVLFSTYTGLISLGRQSTGKTRMDELLDWLCDGGDPREFDGVVVFDEAHKAKNFREDEQNSTQVGKAVHALQAKLPSARVVYASATCVSHVEDMQYMTRLGYWGPQTHFENFTSFRNAMEKAGVTGMELLAVDMKTTGRAVVRNVSYQGAEFRMAIASLTPDKARVYREACSFWFDLQQAMKDARLLCTGQDENEENDDEDDEEEQAMQGGAPGEKDEEKHKKKYQHMMAQYWAAHQRFFAQLILSMKVDLAVEEIKKAVANGMCAVIGLQSTGGAALARAVESEGLDEMEETDRVVSVCKSIARLLINSQFPTVMNRPPKTPKDSTTPAPFAFYQPSPEELTQELGLVCEKFNVSDSRIKTKIFNLAYDPILAERVSWPMYRADGAVVEAERMRAKLLRRLDAMDLPPCAIDDLIDKLGGPDQVAEMTGRTIRQVRNARGKYIVESRASRTELNREPKAARKTWWVSSSGSGTEAADSLNVAERETFLRGEKLVAVISAAASTGISLHADRNVPNQRRRFHCTLELPWAADQAIQQLGRTHRTNQSSAPVYCLISSGLGGENRFVSSVARRLQSLGAITQGDRRASLGAMSLGDLQLESKCGTQALRELYISAGLLNKQKDEVVADPDDASNGIRKGPKVSEGCKWEDIVADSRAFIDMDASGSARLSEEDRSFCTPLTCATETEFLQVVLSGLEALGIDHKKKRDKFQKKGGGNGVTKFLNRLLGLPFTQQTVLFNYFCAILEVKISSQDTGFRNLEGKVTRAKAKKILYRDRLGRPVFADFLLVDRSMTFEEAVREMRFLVAREYDQRVERESIKVESKSSVEDISVLMKEAAKLDIHFYVNVHAKDTERRRNPVFHALLACPGGKGRWTIYRPYNGTGTAHLSDADLDNTYARCTDVKQVRSYWNLGYEKRMESDTFSGVEEVTILTGNLVPIIPVICSLESTDDKVDAYLARTVDGERILGIRPKYFDKVARALNEKQCLQSQFTMNFGSVPYNPPWNCGFNVDSNGQVVEVSPRGQELGLKKNFSLVAINSQPFQPSSRVIDLETAIKDYLANNGFHIQRKSMNVDAFQLSLTISRPADEVAEEAVDVVAHVSFRTMELIVKNPKKERKSIEKQEKELRKLFDSDSDDERVLPKSASLKSAIGSSSLKRSGTDRSSKSGTKKKARLPFEESDSSEDESASAVKTKAGTGGAKRLSFSGTASRVKSTGTAETDGDLLDFKLSKKAKTVPSPVKAPIVQASGDDDDEDLLSFNFRRRGTL